ncbi:hypothetical protein [Hymenobacter sp. B81]|uniref:hypothetical protein n=1 Tax=Hymenobacter sp. B81 TaxID=3344878 RepID=UPI0037DDB43F
MPFRKTFLLVCVACFGACQQQAPTELHPESKPAAGEAGAPEQLGFQRLLQRYAVLRPPLRFSTTEIEADTAVMHAQRGEKPVPDDLIRLLKPKGNMPQGNDVFAIGQLDLAEQRVGLFTRVPGTYVPSKITFSIANTRTREIEASYEVAETFGDAGNVYIRTTRVTRTPAGNLRFQIDQSNCWALDDDLKETECVDSAFVYQFAHNRLRLISKQKRAEH